MLNESIQEEFIAQDIDNSRSNELLDRINNANNGDIILIEPGNYKFHGVNITKNITLQGNGNPRDIIIDGEGLSTIFFIKSDLVTVVFNNLTLINGKTNNSGGAISLETGKAYVNNCIFVNNSALEGSSGGAISNYGTEKINGYLCVNNSLFLSNYADYYGGALSTFNGRSDVYNSVFINNSVHRDGGAICVNMFGYGFVQDCIFIYNHANDWAGAYYSWAGNSSVDRCVFLNNTAGLNGGAFMVSGSLNLTNSIIVNNTSNKTGGSFYIQRPMFIARTVIKVENNLITNNTSPLGKEIFVRWNASQLFFPSFDNNDWGDENPKDYNIIDPNNVTPKMKPTVDREFNGWNNLRFDLLDLYADILGMDVNQSSNNSNLSSDLDSNSNSSNSIGSTYKNNKSSDVINNSNNVNSLSPIFNNEDLIYSSFEYQDNNSTEDSSNRKGVTNEDNNISSYKSMDIGYILILVVVATIIILLISRRKRD